jgi:hypothetical protein
VGPFQELWSGELLRIKEIAEEGSEGRKRTKSRKRKRHQAAKRRFVSENSETEVELTT